MWNDHIDHPGYAIPLTSSCPISLPDRLTQSLDTGTSLEPIVVHNTDSVSAINIHGDHPMVNAAEASEMRGSAVPPPTTKEAPAAGRPSRYQTLVGKGKALHELTGAYVIISAIPKTIEDQYIFVSNNLRNTDPALAANISREIDKIRATAIKLARVSLAIETHVSDNPRGGKNSPMEPTMERLSGKALKNTYSARLKTLIEKGNALTRSTGAYVVIYCARPETIGKKPHRRFVSDNFQADPTLAKIMSRTIDTIHDTAREVARLSLPDAYPGARVSLPSAAEQPADPSTDTAANPAAEATTITRTQKGRQAVSAESHETVVPLLSDDNTIAQKGRVERACDACRQRKRKCDRSATFKNACSYCMRSRIACTYVDDDKMVRKKRCVDRACDACHQRQNTCDGPEMVENVCTNCIQSRQNRTYMEQSKRRASKAYITALEDKIEQMDALLKMLQPEFDFDAELGPPIIRDSWKMNPSTHPPTKLHPDSSGKQRSSSYSACSAVDNRTSMSTGTYHKQDASGKGKAQDPQPGSNDSEDDWEIVRSMRLLNLNSEDTVNLSTSSDPPLRYGGKSSDFGLLQEARAAKQEYIEEMKLAEGGNFERSMGNGQMQVNRRPEFWQAPSWELDWNGSNGTSLIYKLNSALPPPDLSRELIDIWFQNVNIHFPLLHRPTFERQWQSGLQYRDVWFAALSLSIFAVASRWCEDARVLPDDVFNTTASGEISLCSAGKKYYDAALPIHYVRKATVVQPCLAEIQTHAAMAIYLRGTTDIFATWICISLGLRKAQDLGAHRKQMYVEPSDIVEELWRRVYWILVVLDRLVNCALRRPCCVRETDCDLSLPTEIDDEHWDINDKHPLIPKQPTGRPALITSFNRLIRLTRIIELLMNLILAVDTSKLRIGIPRGPRWKEEVLVRMNLDMALWIDSMPRHLRWSPSMVDQRFSDQAATLYLNYYLLQMATYRPFTPFASVSSEHMGPVPNFPFPASIICINAAKACARILNVQMRQGFSNIRALISAAYFSAMLLIDVLKIDTNDRVPQIIQPETTKFQSMSISDAISICVEALEFAALRWDSAYAFLQKIKASLPYPMLEPTPRHPPDPVYPHLPPGSDDRIIPHEPDNLHELVPSLPFALPDPIEIATPIDSVTDWFTMPQTLMCVSTSYPPRSHHYSSQSTWPERSHNDFAPSIYDNWPPPNRPLMRTSSVDNFDLHSYSTVPVPGSSTGTQQQVTSGWESQADRHTVPHLGHDQSIPELTLPVDVPWPMHGQTRFEQSLNCDTEGFQWSSQRFNQEFEQTFLSGLGYPQEPSYPQ